MKKDDKVLVVIPAYNEEKNIEKVINDVKKNIKFADILIINDKSNELILIEKNYESLMINQRIIL